jgi:hypothetical protein
VSALLTEELLEKIMLAKAKHKKLWLPMQFLLNNLMELNESYRKSLIPYGKVH